MTIKVGDKLPDTGFMVMTAEGPAKKSTADIFAGKKVALFAVPGAYTPTCQQQHMPGFVSRVDELKGKGIDVIACTAVNDIFVLTQFAKDTGAAGKIVMLADGNGDFAKALGLDIDLSGFGLGLRSKRYAMLVDNGVVKVLNVEDLPPAARQIERRDVVLDDRPLARLVLNIRRLSRRLCAPVLNSAMPMRASSSARSFSACPACPLIQRQSMSWTRRASSRRCHSSAFFTGFLSAVRQPFFFQPWIQAVMPFFT